MTADQCKKIEADIAFIRKVGELGESDRAIKMAKHLMPALARDKLDDRASLARCVEVRKILVRYLDWPDNENGEKSELEKHILILIDELLSLRDVKGAIGWLTTLAEHYKDSRSWDIYERITEEFALDPTLEVVKEVDAAFFKLIDICDVTHDEEEMRAQCKRYARFLCSKHVDVNVATGSLGEFSDWMPGNGWSQLLIEMAKDVIHARGEEVGTALTRVLADCYAYVGDHQNAIRSYLELVLFEELSDEHIDYLIWIGQECSAARQSKKAGMFLREALRRLGPESQDERAIRARELLEE